MIDRRLLGMALPFFCSDMFAKTITNYDLNDQLVYYSAYAFALFLLAGVVAVCERTHPGGDLRIGLVSTVGSVLLCVAYLLMLVSISTQSSILFVMAALIGSFGVANCYAKWFFLYSRVSLRTATVSMLISYTLGSTLRLITSYLTLSVALVLAAVLVALFHFYYLRSLASLTASSVARDAQTGFAPVAQAAQSDSLQTFQVSDDPGLRFKAKALIPFVVILLLYSLSLALVRAVNVEAQYLIAPNTLNLFLRALFPLLLIPYVAYGRLQLNFITIYQVSLVLVVTCVLIIRVFSDSNIVLAVALTSFTRGLIILFLFLSLIQLIQDRAFHPLVVVGISWGTYVLAQGLGFFAYVRFDFELSSASALNIIYLLVAFTMSTLIFINQRSLKNVPPDTEPPTPRPSALETDYEKELHNRFGLTNREIEVMNLICQGRSKRHIAAALTISENTVRGHVKALYAKCNIHTKQQLIDLMQETRTPYRGNMS